MTKTIALRGAINEKLKGICPRVHYRRAVTESGHPYIVYMLEALSHEDGMTLFELELNIVDHGKDTGPAETLCDVLQAALDRWVYIDSVVEFAVYAERVQAVDEEDPNIIRRRMTFEVRLHERG